MDFSLGISALRKHWIAKHVSKSELLHKFIKQSLNIVIHNLTSVILGFHILQKSTSVDLSYHVMLFFDPSTPFYSLEKVVGLSDFGL